MSVFVDTSALVKLYVAEVDSAVIRGIASVTISELTRAELPAALHRKRRAGELSGQQAEVLARTFEADYYGEDGDPRFTVMRISDRTMITAAGLVARADLRAGDAIQLASALVARQVGREVTAFATFDARLHTAAAVEGFTLVPPRPAA